MAKRTCSIDGCDRPHHARGWCRLHWKRWIRYGDTSTVHPRRRPAPGPCSIPECESRARARGWCEKHYARWRKHGDPEYVAGVADRFWSKVDQQGPDDCWPWLAATFRNGYGAFVVGGRKGSMTTAHRTAWELANEQRVPEGLFVCHRCDNRPCCNPRHLFLGSQEDNMRDMLSKGRGRWADAVISAAERGEHG